MGERKAALRAQIDASRQELLTAIHAMADEEWDRPTSNPSWTARDILAHLTAAEPGLLARMRRILDGTSELPANFDLNTYNARQVEKRRASTVTEMLTSLEGSRTEMLRFLDGLSEEQLDVRGWNARRQEATVANILEDLARHEREHARDILTARDERA
jgi:uncharacterized protein (TIGR03083 family)